MERMNLISSWIILGLALTTIRTRLVQGLNLQNSSRGGVQIENVQSTCKAAFFFYPKDNDFRKGLGIEIMLPILHAAIVNGVHKIPENPEEFVKVSCRLLTAVSFIT